MKKTVLYDEHIKQSGKMIEFTGYLLPVYYTSISEEHELVRSDFGCFDCSHMGEIMISGEDAYKFTDYLVTQNLSGPDLRMSYGFLLNENGGVVDDIMVYKYNDSKFLLVVNASNKEKDYEHIMKLFKKGKYNCDVVDMSDDISLLAIQGPNAASFLQKDLVDQLDELKMYDFKYYSILGMKFLISRSGYTGGDGFEIYGKNEDILKLYQHLTKRGMKSCGLGARDTLRFEAALPLYGQELDMDINPLEAGLSFGVDFNKDFYGKAALSKIKEEGLKRRSVGLELLGPGIARHGYKVYSEGKEIGYVTTGYMIPNTKDSYAVALIDRDEYKLDKEVEILVHKKFVKAKIIKKKFMDKKYQK